MSLDNIFGPVRLIIDKLKELEMRGEAYGFSQYLPKSIILYRASENSILYQVFIPSFPYYFEFLLEKDEKTKALQISDYRVVYPAPVKISDSQILKELIQDYLTMRLGGGQNE
ncbi:hypothetical protein QIT29_gp14 [Metallosphaera rod-shaped virus 1]|uniref:Uncharacterized protein n=1 Tax=Metallosphaera rod-shaped virus 1 TaxID=2730618 RepID=A0A6M3VYV0_9VIRU|nr:hypothetical protein QIT29_gp14 [Metallosphaera rod-shaped virus 1]QJF12360.1 hypothetical protein MRV1_gp14 [Metallosphaera rod-shaped virus 1]